MSNRFCDSDNDQVPTNMESLYHYFLNRKHTWKDLQFAVRATRSIQQKLISRIPNSFTFSGHRLYFLAAPRNSRENTIQYVDIIPGVGAAECVEWTTLLHLETRQFTGFSREEQLMRERKRLGSFGITSYDYHNGSGRFLFAASNRLHTCVDDSCKKVGDEILELDGSQGGVGSGHVVLLSEIYQDV